MNEDAETAGTAPLKAQLAAALHQAATAGVLLAPGGEVLTANAAASSLLRLDRPINGTVAALPPAATAALRRAAVQSVTSGRPAAFLLDADIIEVRATALDDAAMLVWLHGSRTALADRLRQELEPSLDAAGSAFWQRTLDPPRTQWDAAMYALHGIDLNDTRDPHELFQRMLHRDDRARVEQAWQRVLDFDDAVDVEFRIVRPDGQTRALATRALAERGAGGAPLRVVGVARDITHLRERTEAARAQLDADLAQRAKNEFVARMSYELRTPLNAILGFTQLLELDPADAPSAGQRERIERIRASGWHLLNLINEVLDLTRIESGASTVTMDVVALAPLIDEVLAAARPQAEVRQVSLTLARAAQSSPSAKAGAPRAVWADRARLKQVLATLVANAIKHNRHGGSATVALDHADGNSVVIAVRDTGNGLTPKQLEAIFEPFSRLGMQTVEPRGSGVALAVAKRLTEQMRGVLDVRSKPGIGSEFRVRLHEAMVARTEDAARPAPSPTLLALREDVTGAILYIEDNPLNSLLVEQLLHSRPNVRLYNAADGATGLVLAAACRPDLVLVDMRLPDMEGLELLARLRAQAETSQVACVALSANALPDDVQRALDQGFARYWTKPFDAQVFLAGVDEFLTNAPARR